jgi:adenylate cyclase
MSTITPQAADSIADWLLTDARRLVFPALVDGLAWRLRASGIPLDRLVVSLRVLSSSVLAVAVAWRPGAPIAFRTFDYADRDSGFYQRSPFRVIQETGEPLILDLDATPDERFGIVPELKAEGLHHYACLPLFFSDGAMNALTLASKEPGGLSPAAMGFIDRLLPALTAVLEIRTYHRVLREVLATYVGRGPSQQIVQGTVHRGEVTRIRAALMFADLRGFTALSSRLPPEATADLLNRYFDVLVPAVTSEGGEVLKFIGDGLLAIFEDGEEGTAAACARSLASAEAALATGDELEAMGEPVRFGIALHHGEAVYGNVGAVDRLDFTVVGRDVNVVSRISNLCSILGRPLLVSESFAAALGSRRFRPQGAHRVRGIDAPLAVLEPAAAEAA